MRTEQQKVIDLLRRAGKWFDKPNSTVRDWLNTFEEDKDGNICRVCLLGAVRHTVGGDRKISSDFIRREAERYLREAIHIITPERGVLSRRTRRECQETYRLAIKMASMGSVK